MAPNTPKEDNCKPLNTNTSIWYFVRSSNLIQLLFSIAVFSIFSQIFGISLAVYKVVTDQNSIYKPWIPFGVGAIVATWIWKRLNPRLGHTPEKVFTNLGIIVAIIGLILLIPYLGVNQPPPAALMYVGFTLLGICISWFNVNQEIVFSKQISWMTHVNESNRDGTFLSMYMMVNSFGHFLGPFLAGYAMVIQQNPQSDSICLVTTGSYENEGCELTNYGAWIGGMLAMLAIALALNLYFDFYVVDYTTDPIKLNDYGGRLGSGGGCTSSLSLLKDIEDPETESTSNIKISETETVDANNLSMEQKDA